MLSTYLYAFGSVLAVSLVSMIGVFALSFKTDTLKRYVFLLVSLAVGALLGDAFIHLIAESLRATPEGLTPSLLIIGGIILFLGIEKFLHWHHHEDDETPGHVHPVGKLILFSDGVHNFMDGIIIGASFLVSIPVGLATTIAVILHEIPQEIGDFAILLHAGYEKKRALLLNFFSAVFAVLGTALAFILGGAVETFEYWVLPIAAGGFIYIALADLIPELQTKRAKYSAAQMASILLGVALMAALAFLE